MAAKCAKCRQNTVNRAGDRCWKCGGIRRDGQPGGCGIPVGQLIAVVSMIAIARKLAR